MQEITGFQAGNSFGVPHKDAHTKVSLSTHPIFLRNRKLAGQHEQKKRVERKVQE